MTHLASDEEQIRDIITGFSHHVDHRRWQELQALFSDDVTVDYSSLFGGEPQTLSATDLVTGWRTRLSPLRATQHLLGPIAVELRESGANAACHVRGYHFREGLLGGPDWMVAGHYLFSLGKQSGSWKIQRLQLEFFYQTGNAKLLDEAAKL
jgi:uncharacterized protein YijF (DUF1287 family)